MALSALAVGIFLAYFKNPSTPSLKQEQE